MGQPLEYCYLHMNPNTIFIYISNVYKQQFLCMQYPIIRNGAEFRGKFKKRAPGRSNLRNASKNLRNAQCSDFQN